MKNCKKIVATGLLAMLILATFGCGPSGLPPLGTVHGTVTIDGQPVEGASIEFIPENGRPSVGETDTSGNYNMMFTYDADGALVGKHTVRITTAREGVVSEGDGPSIEARPELLPAKYNEASELQVDVAAGDNTFDFDLEGK
ncbi:hypothetical protein Poly24_12040 [Rosistilla carotiformis]|uniref:Carboxypeptidase regulatory-like domain-containing protein n=1 Tax=Rosistilla carotiformis TaxID=2528017 RepID=A0A518JPP2_9BACT|nr:DUF4198 domain-containing protein [Rosistilla carotiformis]QDV67504.1 hypothetical protein Poly24_12040 [Rosistilla carotiformis]